ncbi:MAG: hypothetical protein V4541_05395 [Bacteroidota bacterium]
MKLAPIFIGLCLALGGCGNRQNNDSNTWDTISLVPTKPQAPSLTQQDSIKAVGKQILQALKHKDWQQFSLHFLPNSTVLFSPYGYIDKSKAKQLPAADFLMAIQKNWILTWGSFDGTGEPIQLTIPAYFEKFVYNADYLNAEKTGYDQVIGKGNSLVNLQEAYPGLHFIEYHFTGFDPKYKGMDWTSLRLVFKKQSNQYFLVAVIHDQWTV